VTLTQKRRSENENEIENDEVLYPKFMVCFFDCSQLLPYLYIFTHLESNTFPPKNFKQLLKQINSPKCTKEGQCLTLFATEMVFSQKAVSDLHWKNVA
jgi:hypothetical protein